MTASEPSERGSTTRKLRARASQLRRAAVAYRAERNLFALGLCLDPGTGQAMQDVDALLEAMLETIVGHPNVDRAGLVAYDPATGDPREVDGLPLATGANVGHAGQKARMSTGILARVHDHGEAVYVTRMVDNPEFGGRASVKALQLETVFVAPIGGPGGPPVGALYALAHERRDGFPLGLCLGIEAATRVLLPLMVNRRDDHVLPDLTAPYRRGGRFSQLVGSSAQLGQVLRTMSEVLEHWTQRPVLLVGPSGTGKNLAAACLVHNGRMADRPFHELQLATMEPPLAEELLFGSVEPAVTGAGEVDGLIRRTRGGTLFLDGIEAASPSIQAKLVQLLEEGTYRRRGGTSDCRGDVWLLAAANTNLKQEMEGGRFRKDLYYLLQGRTIALPPLKRRLGDISQLARHFALEACDVLDLPAVRFATPLMDAMQNMPWPGNVRQLREMVWAMVELTGGGNLGVHTLSRAMVGPRGDVDLRQLPTLDLTSKSNQRIVLVTLMQSWGPEVTDVATRLDIRRETLERLLRRLGLSGLGDETVG